MLRGFAGRRWVAIGFLVVAPAFATLWWANSRSGGRPTAGHGDASFGRPGSGSAQDSDTIEVVLEGAVTGRDGAGLAGACIRPPSGAFWTVTTGGGSFRKEVMREFLPASGKLTCWKYGFLPGEAVPGREVDRRVRMDFVLDPAPVLGIIEVRFQFPGGAPIADFPFTLGARDAVIGGVVTESPVRTDATGVLRVPVHDARGRVYLYPRGSGVSLEESPVEFDLGRAVADGFPARTVRGRAVACLTAALDEAPGDPVPAVFLTVFPDWGEMTRMRGIDVGEVVRYTAFPLPPENGRPGALERIPRGAYRVLACFRGRAPRERRVTFERDEAVPLLFGECGVETVACRVTGADGAGLPGAIVIPFEVRLNDIVQILNVMSGLVGGTVAEYFLRGDAGAPGFAKCAARLRDAGFGLSDAEGRVEFLREVDAGTRVTVFHPRVGLLMTEIVAGSVTPLDPGPGAGRVLRIAPGPPGPRTVVAVVEDPLARVGGAIHPVDASYLLPPGEEGRVSWPRLPPGDYRVASMELSPEGEAVKHGPSTVITVGPGGEVGGGVTTLGLPGDSRGERR